MKKKITKETAVTIRGLWTLISLPVIASLMLVIDRWAIGMIGGFFNKIIDLINGKFGE